MLALDAPLGTVADTVLFGDHADPGLVHVVPTRPRLVVTDGRPALALQHIRPEDASEAGAALLSFTTELSVDEEQRRAIHEHLAELGGGEARLAQIQWEGGRAVFAAALQEGDGFVEKLLGDVPCATFGDNRAVFSLMLTEDGASLVEGLLSQTEGPSPLGVRYDLTYLGLRPALDVRIRADYSRVFDEFAAGFEFGVAYQGVGVRAGVETATRKLLETGAIEVEVMHFTDDADVRARVDQAVQWFQDRLLRDFFQSSLRPPGPGGLLERATEAAIALGANSLRDALLDSQLATTLAEQLGVPMSTLGGLGQSGAGGSAAGGGESTFALNVQFQLRDVRTEERKVVELDWREARAELRSAAPQALLHELGAVPVVTSASDAADLWKRLTVNVRPLGDFDEVGAERMLVRLAHPGEDGVDAFHKTLTFEAGAIGTKPFSVFTDGRPPSYRYRSQVHFRDDGPVPGPPIEDGPWRSASADELALHVLAEVDLLDLEVTAGTVDLNEVPQIQVDLAVDGEHVTSLTVSAEDRAVRHRRRLPRAGADGEAEPDLLSRVTYRPTWFLRHGERIQGEPTQLTSPLLAIEGPWRGARTIRLFPMLPDDVLEATATVSLVGSSSRRQIHFGPDSERRSVEVVLPSLDAAPPPAQVETIVVLRSGVHFAPKLVTEAAVVVVQAGEGQHRRVTVRLIAGDDLREHGVMAVQVQLLGEGGEPVDSVSFTDSARGPGELLVPVADDGAPAPARYLVTRFRPDGMAVRDAVLETVEDALMIPAAVPPAP